MIEASVIAETACPRYGGRLVISNERRLLVGMAVLWINCGQCGLFQHCDPVERENGVARKRGKWR